MMKIGVIGGTGFVGSYLIDALLDNGHDPVLLVRQGSEDKVRDIDRCTVVAGDLAETSAVEEVIRQSEAVIYLIGILREFPSRGITFKKLQLDGVKTCVDLAREHGGKRFLLMSANGVEKQSTAYQQTKYAAEQVVRGSGLNCTIFRPSVVFGDPRGKMEFASQLLKEIIRPPLPAPLFFDGLKLKQAGMFKLAPVHVSEVAAAFVDALEDEDSNGKTVLLCGPEALTWKEILRRIAAAVGQQKIMIPAPALGVKSLAAVFDRFAFFPVTREQITMLLQGNTCETGSSDLNGKSKYFSDENLDYLKNT